MFEDIQPPYHLIGGLHCDRITMLQVHTMSSIVLFMQRTTFVCGLSGLWGVVDTDSTYLTSVLRTQRSRLSHYAYARCAYLLIVTRTMQRIGRNCYFPLPC